MPTSDRFEYLFSQYISNQCTEPELQELFSYFNTMSVEDLQPYMDAVYEKIQPGQAVDTINWNELYSKITAEKPAKIRKLPAYSRIAVAASILLMAGIALWNLVSRKPSANTNNPTVAATTDIAPGRDQAILTLADGTRLVLDSTANGNIAEQGGIRIFKQAGGELSYMQQNGQPLSTGLYNTLSTPRGGQYRLVLPDGSKVWLNSASSIRYPAAFNNRERRVEITGEAYFEIARFQHLPFYVKSPVGEVQVLGTKFNINAYTNEPQISTTLVEGKIGLRTAASEKLVILEPGHQAVYAQGSSEQPEYLNQLKIQKVDTDPVIAWTRNAFVFSNTSLAAASRQLERWYDVEMILQGDIANESIMASFSRDIPISRVMHKLSLTGHLKFSINGKKIIVTR